MSETPQGVWLGRARKGSLWLCYAVSLAGRQKSGISGNRRRPKPTPWERNSWGTQKRRKMRKKSEQHNGGESTQILELD